MKRLIALSLLSSVALAEEAKPASSKKWDVCKFKQDKATITVSCSKTKVEEKVGKEVVSISTKVISKIKRTYENGNLVSEQILPNE